MADYNNNLSPEYTVLGGYLIKKKFRIDIMFLSAYLRNNLTQSTNKQMYILNIQILLKLTQSYKKIFLKKFNTINIRENYRLFLNIPSTNLNRIYQKYF